ncbi:Ig-like domain-containing protein [Candidatus Solirubrobacter pratensis]|uniref:hypothetical protein n=1 Tax=Candidatus Solirubrobacter pratensis TaxID=1298857 RepID=UPI00040A5426|nr:hypothetical protein [Candidatus Solirubrobacter pratensis]
MTCAAGLAAASSASANDVVLWACHGPTGKALGAGPFGGAAEYGTGCGVDGTALAAGGVFSQSFGLVVRPGVVLKRVSLLRGASGLDTENRYSATYEGAEFDGSSTDVSGAVSAPIADTGNLKGGFVKFATTRAGTGVSVQRVGLTVADTTPPAGTGGIANHTNGSVAVAVWINDTGVGLDHADLYVDDAYYDGIRFSDNCADMTPGDGVVDLPIENSCPAHVERSIDLDTSRFADGEHRVTVKVYDAAGNATDYIRNAVTEIGNHPNLGSNTATLSIGSGNAAGQNGSAGSGGGTGGVAGASATSCASPKLSMELSQKPLKISKGVPVLKYGKRYRFRGHLTCVVKGKRHSAPVKTPIELFNTIGKKTYRKSGATVRSKGAITLVLAYKSSRTLVFRYTNADGRRSQVKLKVKVTRRSR